MPSDTSKNYPKDANSLVSWRELRAKYQAHIIALISNPMRPAFFDLSKVFPETDELPILLDQLDDLKKCLDSFRPLNPAQLKNLQRGVGHRVHL